MEFELEKMLLPVSGDNPSGENEEYNPLYSQLEELAIGKPASAMGDSVVEGVDPDWRGLKKACLKLWETTRDLRVAMYLCVAELSLDGLKGFSDALSAVEYLVSEQWNEFYPQLDPDDDNDPTERMNIFAMIAPPPGSYNDPLMFINKFRMVHLLDDKKYTLRDLLIVNGDLDVGEQTLDPLLFQGEMRSVPVDVMKERKALVDKIVSQIANITEKVNANLQDTSVSFSSLSSELKTLQKFYAQYTVEGAAEEAAAPEQTDAGDAPARPAAHPATRAFDLSTFVPSNRSEALMLLKKGAEYFQRAEPTSPVPLLIDRAIRMSGMTFLELLGDVEPNALEKGREIFGVRPESFESSDN